MLVASAGALHAPSAVAAPDTLHFTLEQAVEHALTHGVEMRLATAQVSVAHGRVREAMADALPQVTGSMTYGRVFESVYSGTGGDSSLASLFESTPFGAVHSWSGEITASQLIWSGGRFGAGLSAARAVRRSSQAESQEVAARVTQSVKKAYLEAAYARQVLEIAEAGLAQAREHMNQVALYRREGSRAEYDLIRAQVDARNEEPPVVAAGNAWNLALLDLKRLMSLDLDQPIALETAITFDGSMVPVVDDASFDASRRAVLAQADADVEAREQLLRLERAQRWPRLTLTGAYQQMAFPPNGNPRYDDFHANFDAKLRLEFPLFLGGRTFGAVQRAAAELRQTEVQREQLRQSIGLELERARQEVRRTLAVLAARRGTVSLAGRAYHLASVRYGSGLATQLEVSDARLQMLTAQTNEVQATKDYRVALVDLEFELGRPLPTEDRPLEQISLAPEGPRP